MIAREAASQLTDTLRRLPEDQRRVIQLRHLEELTHESIANQMGKSTAAVRMLWVRALRNLRKLSIECEKSTSGNLKK